jgi:MoaA/NifB/PqqE/SkfB family radical SAM enzyme
MLRDKSRPIGLRAEDPHIYELNDMFEFCKKYKEIYICGTDIKSQMLRKLLKNCAKIPLRDDEVDVLDIDAILEKKEVGIILGIADEHYRKVIPKFRKLGFSDYFIPSEWNKRTIAEKLERRDADYNSFEISLTDHCNISCQMCDHFSQLSEPWFIDTEILDRDLKRMAELCKGQCAVITLIGGEPLLHPKIAECLEIGRKHFPSTPIILLTNAILLLKLDGIWEACKKQNITISITRYPIKLDYNAIINKAAECGVEVLISSDIHSEMPLEEAKVSYKHTFDLNGTAEEIFFPSCHYFNHLGVVKDGKYYMCPVSAHIDIFNKRFNQNLQLTEKDSVDIFKAQSFDEIAEFLANKIPFCSYCDIKKWGSHSVWKPSTKKIEEYV